MKDLAGFLSAHREHFVWIGKPVPIDAIGALTAQANRPILFENVEDYDMPVVDLLFVDRAAQARVLGCAPAHGCSATCSSADPRPSARSAPSSAQLLLGRLHDRQLVRLASDSG